MNANPIPANVVCICTLKVADSLDNLLEDLSGLNRAIVNADPIPANVVCIYTL